VHPPDRIKKKEKKKTSKMNTTKEPRSLVFIRLNRVEIFVLLLPHDRQRKFLFWDVQIIPAILGGLHGLQVGEILLYVMSHLLMSAIWDMIPYQHLSHDSWPLCFLTPHLVPTCVMFVRVLTSKVTESCSFKS
jgi:hypothetical protein